MRHEGRKLLQALRLWGIGVDLAQFRENPGSFRGCTRWLIAAVHQERLFGVDGSQAVRLAELPVVDEAVVARGAFHVDAQKGLGDVLSELNFLRLAGADGPAPADTLNEAFG